MMMVDGDIEYRSHADVDVVNVNRCCRYSMDRSGFGTV